MKQNKNIIIGLVVVVIIAVIAAIGISGSKKNANDNTPDTQPSSSSSASSGSTANAVATMAVNIKNYMFEPMAIKVKVGDSVTWTNQDGVKHNVVADKPSADAPNGPLIAKGETYSFTFKKAGTYTFHCMPHPYMHGTVVVTQ